MYEMLKGILLGALFAFVLVCAHVISTALKNEYYNVGRAAAGLENTHPAVYALLYRAKQHSLQIKKVLDKPAKGLASRLINMYKSFTPDPKYLRLERNITKLANVGNAEQATKEKIIKRSLKDICFLDEAPTPSKKRNFIIGLVMTMAKRLILPERDGPVEPNTAEARKALKIELESYIKSFSDGSNYEEPSRSSNWPFS